MCITSGSAKEILHSCCAFKLGSRYSLTWINQVSILILQGFSKLLLRGRGCYELLIGWLSNPISSRAIASCRRSMRWGWEGRVGERARPKLTAVSFWLISTITWNCTLKLSGCLIQPTRYRHKRFSSSSDDWCFKLGNIWDVPSCISSELSLSKSHWYEKDGCYKLIV